MTRGGRSSYAMHDALEKLKIGRSGAVTVAAGEAPFKDRYNKAAAVTEAIDALVEELTGEREMLWNKPHG